MHVGATNSRDCERYATFSTVTYFFSSSESITAIQLNPGALEEVAKGNIGVLNSPVQEDGSIV